MAVETLAAFRNAAEGMNVQPIIIVTKDSNGNLILAKTDPATGALVVTATIDAGALATEATLQAIGVLVTSILGAVDGVETLLGDISARSPGDILAGIVYDAVTQDRSGATTDVWRFYTGGTGGTLVATVTITYATTDKEDIASVVKT